MLQGKKLWALWHYWKQHIIQCAVTHSCLTLSDAMDCSLPGSSIHGGFSRQENESGLPCPPPGIFPTQGADPGILHCRQILCHLSHHHIIQCPTELQRMEDSLTFGYCGHLKSDADHSHQISQWNQRPQNRPDSDGFSLGSMNQLQKKKTINYRQKNKGMKNIVWNQCSLSGKVKEWESKSEIIFC